MTARITDTGGQRVIDVLVAMVDGEERSFIVPVSSSPVGHAGGFFALTTLNGTTVMLNQDTVDGLSISPMRDATLEDFK
jgi:hypothetical protein